MALVASQSFIGQTDFIASTIILTAVTGGIYRISTYGASSDPTSGRRVDFNFTFTDEYGNTGTVQPLSIYSGIAFPGNVEEEAWVLYLKAGSNFTISASQSGTLPCPSPYSLYVAVESLF